MQNYGKLQNFRHKILDSTRRITSTNDRIQYRTGNTSKILKKFRSAF